MFQYNAVVTKVVDGDTIYATVDLGFNVFHKVKLRLSKIDTPEIFRPSCEEEKQHGLEAKAFLSELVLNQDVVIATSKTGKYGRWIAEVFYLGNDVQEMLIENGFEKREVY
jgi:micrococcal nuclease